MVGSNLFGQNSIPDSLRNDSIFLKINSFVLEVHEVIQFSNLLEKKNYDTCLILLQNPKLLKNLGREEMAEVSKMYSNLGDCKSANVFLDLYLNNQYTFFKGDVPDIDSFKRMDFYKDFGSCFSLDSIYNILIVNTKRGNDSIRKKLNLRDEINQLKFQDQFFRSNRNVNIPIFKDYFNRTCDTFQTNILSTSDSLWFIQTIFDSINRVSLDKFYKRNHNKWFSDYYLGYKAAYTAFLVVQHSDKDIAFQAKYFQKMLDYYKESNSTYLLSNCLMYLIDRILVNKYNFQFFGTQFMNSSSGITLFSLYYGVQFADAFRTYCNFPSVEKYIRDVDANFKIK